MTTRVAASGAESPPHQLPLAWRTFLGRRSDEMLAQILGALAREGDFYPAADLFKALELCAPDEVRVVLLGQDPYHGEGQAHGLAFSVPDGVAIPPSLRNIFQELRSDLELPVAPSSGNLTAWASQGVLLLNSILSVKPNAPASHAHLGWQEWTDLVLREVSFARKDTVFLLWGDFAKQKRRQLSQDALVISARHPSPLSANKGGFFGGRYFSKVNALLATRGSAPIDWASIH
jgi:uracil-DNA glycosylase